MQDNLSQALALQGIPLNVNSVTQFIDGFWNCNDEDFLNKRATILCDNVIPSLVNNDKKPVRITPEQGEWMKKMVNARVQLNLGNVDTNAFEDVLTGRITSERFDELAAIGRGFKEDKIPESTFIALRDGSMPYSTYELLMNES